MVRKIVDEEVPDYKKSKEQIEREKFIKTLLKAQRKLNEVYFRNPRLAESSKRFQVLLANMEEMKRSRIEESEDKDIRQLFMQKEV
jgi:hypothetical protein